MKRLLGEKERTIHTLQKQLIDVEDAFAAFQLNAESMRKQEMATKGREKETLAERLDSLLNELRFSRKANERLSTESKAKALKMLAI